MEAAEMRDMRHCSVSEHSVLEEKVRDLEKRRVELERWAVSMVERNLITAERAAWVSGMSYEKFIEKYGRVLRE